MSVPPDRILLLDFGRSWRGGQAQAFELASGLARRGIEVHVAAPGRSELRLRVEEEGITYHSARSINDIDLPAALRTARLIRDIKPDLIQCNESKSHGSVFLASRLSGFVIPVVVSRRSLDRPRGRRKYAFPNRFAAVSEAVASVLAESGIPRGRIDVVHSGISVPTAEEPGRPAEGLFRIVAMGALEPEKGTDVLVRAMSYLGDTETGVECLILGDGSHRTRLEKMARKLGVPVKFLGHVREFGPIVRSADLMVHPARQEAFGTAILHGLARGLPVVASRVGGIPEAVTRKTGTLVPPNDPQTLARAIRAWIEKPTARAAVQTAGPELATAYSADAMVTKMIACYKDAAV